MVVIDETLTKVAVEQGPWAVLFSALLWWVLRANAGREERYLNIIETLSEDVRDRLSRLEQGMESWRKGGK